MAYLRTGLATGAECPGHGPIAVPWGAFALILVAAVPQPACSAPERSDGTTQTQDSAGVEILTSAQGAWPAGAGWQLSEEPVLQIGAADGQPGYDLFRVTHATKLSDGRIAIANGGTMELRFFSAAGEYLQSSGGEGEGPGEFLSMSGPYVTANDTLVVYDARLLRTSFFGPHGEFARSFVVPRLEGTSLAAAGGFSDGSVLIGVNGSTAIPRPDGLWSDTATYYRLDPRGSAPDTVGRLFRYEFFVYNRPGGFSIGSLPFSPTGTAAVGGDNIVLGDSHRYEFRVHAANGDLVRIVRLAREPEPIDRAVFDSIRDARLDRVSADERARMQALFDAGSERKTMPAFSSFKVDREGNIWVFERPQTADEPRRRAVFNASGVYLGVVETPPGLTIYEAGPDYVIGEVRDDMDVELVVLHALLKNGRVR